MNNTKISNAGLLAFACFSANFSLALVIKVLLIKKKVYYVKVKIIWDCTFFSRVRSQRFQHFRCSKLLNGCLIVWPSDLCLRGNCSYNSSTRKFRIQQFSRFKTDIYDQWFQSFPNNAFETTEFWGIVDLTAFLRLLQTKNSIFP